jgi:hypothetical protein
MTDEHSHGTEDYSHGRGGDCPACKKVQALGEALNAVLETSDLNAINKASTLILFALAELLDEHGLDGSKDVFAELATRRLEQMSDLYGSSHH